ncbi:hypothetical protein PTTG_04253 [Puccinia triticina 1-1 BBBD Race 1]|uniref:C2H2-type domain-containing protein n=1 Tax=Puccinia triticina (isolate 1-1 / race 1 (BBBD)) TaxID=630390 RepID=A0A180GG50_PUCT1|nr:hypothetical protein PTTG_04253 [Puccinia triticina 1-1 BBBD Race 1]
MELFSLLSGCPGISGGVLDGDADAPPPAAAAAGTAPSDIPVNPATIPLDPSLFTPTPTKPPPPPRPPTPTPPPEQPDSLEHSLTPFRVGKNWACRICGRQFTRRFNCSTHERTHLDLKERAQFQCRLCERAFTRRHDLERHVHSVHPGHTVQRHSDRHDPLILAHPSDTDEPNNSNSLDRAQLSIAHPNDSRNEVRILMLEQPPPELAKPAPTDQLMLALSTPTSTPSTTALAPTGTVTATAILASGSIRGVSQAIERVPLQQISAYNPAREPIFKVDKKWACGTCGRVFVRRNNCKAHEATHRDIREHQCPTCARSFSRKHDLERHMSAVHPGVELVSDRGSSPADSGRRKRRKHEGPDEWTAIDPFILGLAGAAASAAGPSATSTSSRPSAPPCPPSPPSTTAVATTSSAAAADVSAHSAVGLDHHQGPDVTLLATDEPGDIQLDPRLLG